MGKFKILFHDYHEETGAEILSTATCHNYEVFDNVIVGCDDEGEIIITINMKYFVWVKSMKE